MIAALLLLLAGQAAAGTAPQSASDILLPQPARGPAVLPSNTPLVLAMTEGLDSAKVREGDRFTMQVARDVLLDGRIAIPRGTVAHGRILWRQGKGGWGKAAKLGFAVDSLELNGRQVPLSGSFREAGKRNGAARFAGLAGVFVTGRSAVVAPGREYVVMTRDPLPLER